MAKKVSAPPKKNKTNLKRALMAANVLVIIGLAATSGYFFQQYRDIKNDQKLTTEQIDQKRVEQVAKVYSLPKDENPIVYTVQDESKFREQFKVFDMGIKDDYLLLYEKAGLAVLYRPSENKVIKTGQVNIKKDISVQLLGTAEQAAETEKTLTEKIKSGFKISSKGPSVGTYGTVTVVDVSGTQADAAKQIAEVVGGMVGALPAGETAAVGADIVIVLATPAQPTL